MGDNNYNNNKGGKPGYGGGNQGNGKKVQYTLEKDFYNPYSFVPFADKVYELSSSEKKELDFIQDIPVDGSLSGKIRIDFESVTPFCVRKGDSNNTNVEGHYYVPGSSIKGMVRSVFEIITYANARNGVMNNRYSMRDLHSPSYELKGNNSTQDCGFLIKYNNHYYIHPCEGKVWKYSDIEKKTSAYDLKFKKKLKDKYNAVGGRLTDSNDGQKAMWFFSGFMNNKKHEFLFLIPDFDKENLIEIKEQEWEDFIFIHEKENKNTSWDYWKKILNNTTSLKDINKIVVPCFYRTKKNEDGKETVEDLGFSYLYRQPYKKRIHDFLPDAHKKDTIDMAQAVFGYVKGNDCLKGRVLFGNAFIDNPNILSKQTFIMGAPKPTFYPFYLQQNEAGKLITYAGNARLSGAKRFLLQDEAQKGDVFRPNVTSEFYPIDKNTKFTTYVYFHNLHDYELGALLSAITFCEKKECHHSLGYAKPFGFGRIKVNNCSIEECDNSDVHALVSSFKAKITTQCDVSEEEWLASISKLFTIAEGTKKDSKTVRYPIMDHKEFENIKNQKLSLKDFEP